MNLDISTLTTVYNNTLEGIIVILYYAYIIDQKKFVLNNKLKSTLYLLTYNVFCFYIDSLIPTGLHTIFYMVFYIIFIGNVTKTSFVKSFVTVMFVSIILIVSELLFILICMLIFRKGYIEIPNIPLFMIFGGLTIRILQLILLLLLDKYNIRPLSKNLFNKKKHIVSTGLAQINIFSFFFILCCFFLERRLSKPEFNNKSIHSYSILYINYSIRHNRL